MSAPSVAYRDSIPQEVECRVCGEFKPVEDYYPKQVRRCGMIGECKECTKRRVRDRARNNPSVQIYDRKRAKTPKRRENARKTTRRWRAENELGRKAHSQVAYALRVGTLKKLPCLFCGADEVHAHHRDYSKPLDVLWLCPKCHHRLHANFPETEAQNKGEARQ